MTFPAGVTEVSLNISILDDNILEDVEQFVLIIGPSTPPRVFVGSFDQATIIIEDNDGK